jgi:hypothetical protein
MSEVNTALRVRYVNVRGKAYVGHDPGLLNCDLVCFAETRHVAGGQPWLAVPGYSTYECCRVGHRQAGGLCVLLRRVSRWFRSGVRVRVDVAHGILWVHANRHQLTVACLYLSPASSRLYQSGVLAPDPLLALMQGVETAQGWGHRCVVVGDMNIRVGGWCCDVPEQFADVPAGLHPALGAIAVDPTVYEGVPRQRLSSDRVVTRGQGDHLMQCLQSACLVVLNGRAPGDEAGAATYVQPHGRGRGVPGTSVVDLMCAGAVV